MRRMTRAATFCVLLLAPYLAIGQGTSDTERAAQRGVLYAKLTNHGLLQIVLAVPQGRSNIMQATDGTWRLVGDVICIDTGPLADEI